MCPNRKPLMQCASWDGIADKLLQSAGSWIAQAQQMQMWKEKRGDRKEIKEERGIGGAKKERAGRGKAGCRAESRRRT